MGPFVIHAHNRLQEWVAQEKGYYEALGLRDYLIVPNLLGRPGDDHAYMTPEGQMYGEYENAELEREASISCGCHWTVNMAASSAFGNLWGECYSVVPGGIVVAPDSALRSPDDLADVEIHVGYHSGSHYASIQALEEVLPPNRITLRFGGAPDERVDSMLAGTAIAANVFGLQYYVLEQLGFRKVIDTTFMVAGIVAKDANLDDVRKYYGALRLAQRDIDAHHQRYVHHYLKELAPRFAELVDVRCFGPGERLVYEPYTRELYDQTHRWIEARGLYDPAKVGHGAYESAVVGMR